MRYVNIRVGDPFIARTALVPHHEWCEGCRCFHLTRIMRFAFRHGRTSYVAIDEIADQQFEVWCYIPKTGEIAFVRFQKLEGTANAS